MKKIFSLSILFFFIFISQQTSDAQILKLGIRGGITSINSPDIYSKSISQGGFGFDGNFHLGAELRLQLPLIPITPLFFVEYHMLRGDGERNNIKLTTSQNILSLGIEGEYNILPLPLVTPYISLGISMNKWSDFQEKSTLASISVPGLTRYGGGIGVGAVVTALPLIDLDVSAKYQTFNLIGKADGESNFSIVNINLTVIF